MSDVIIKSEAMRAAVPEPASGPESEVGASTIRSASPTPREALAVAEVIASLPGGGLFESTRFAALMLLLTDEFVFLSSLTAGFFIRVFAFGFLQRKIAPSQLYYTGLELSILPLCFYLLRFYPSYGIAPPERLRRKVLATVTGFGVLLVAAYLMPEAASSRGMVLFTLAISLPMGIIFDAVSIRLLAKANRWGRPVILAGDSTRCRQLARLLQRQPELGYKPVAICTENHHLWGKRAEGIAVVGGIRSGKLLARHVSTCLVAVSKGKRLTWRRIQSRLPFKRLIVVPRNFGIGTLHTTSRDLGGVLGFEVQQNLRVRTHHRVKRTLDGLSVLPALLISSPAFIFYALFIKIVDPGPVFYSQIRIGLGGKQIKIFKLRTMYTDAAERLNALLESDPYAKAGWERFFKLPKDPRILPGIAKLVRRFSLDELPQLWNVLRGDMSLVGPRPFPKYHLDAFSKQFRSARRIVRPGLTGFWQVSARSDGDLDTQELLDTYYIRNWSLWLDLYILCRTVGVVISGRGAY